MSGDEKSSPSPPGNGLRACYEETGPDTMRTVARSDMPTARMSPAPVVLCVGCTPELVKRIREAAIMGQALLVQADVSNAATLAAETRPLVMVMLEDVYSFDAASFSALAADVRA